MKFQDERMLRAARWCLLVTFLAGLRGVASGANPCCRIQSLDRATGVVTALDAASGRTFQFSVRDPKLVASLQVGQGVYANFKSNQVSLDSRTACCAILSVSAASGGRTPESQSPKPSAPPATAAGTSTSRPPPPTPDTRPAEGTTEGAIRESTSSGSNGGQVSTPGGTAVPGIVHPPVLSNPDIAGEQQPLQYVIHDRSSEVIARFQNIGAEIPADSSAMSPRPTWYVDGQVRQPDDAGTFGVHIGRPAWPTRGERSYAAKFTLPRGSHQLRAVMQVMPGEQNPANNAATIPVMSGEA